MSVPRPLTAEILRASALRAKLQTATAATLDALERDGVPHGMFPGQDDRPHRFIPRARLLIPSWEDDDGTRPVSGGGTLSPGVTILGARGEPLRTLRPNTDVTIIGKIVNFGNADAPAATVEAFLGLNRVVARQETRTLLADEMQVEDVFSMSGRGTVATGPVNSGQFRTGDQVISSTGLTSVVMDVQYSSAGDHVGLLLRGVAKDDISRGDILTGRPARQEEAIQHVNVSDEATVAAMDYLDVAYVDVPCERAATVRIPWRVPSAARLTEVTGATIALRAYCFMPADLPADMDCLDPRLMRHVGASTLKVVA